MKSQYVGIEDTLIGIKKQIGEIHFQSIMDVLDLEYLDLAPVSVLSRTSKCSGLDSATRRSEPNYGGDDDDFGASSIPATCMFILVL